MLSERWIGFACECCGNDFLYAGFACGFSKQSGIDAVSGNDCKNFRRLRLQLSTLAVMPTPLDMQLGERFLQRRLNPCNLCSSVIFLHRGLGALDSGLSRSDVDLFSLQSHV